MTTGSWDRSQPASKLVLTKTWTGTDRPKVVYPKAPLRTVTRYDKRKKQFVQYSFYEKRRNYSKPPKRAYDVDHPYAMTLVHRQDRTVRAENGGPYVGTYQNLDAMANFGATSWTGVSLAAAFDANDQIKLIGKLREKISGSDFDLSLVLGEGHQTLRMIGDTAIRIAKSLHHLKKGDLAGSARSLLEGANRKPLKPYKQMKPFRPTADAVSSKWLELQYGWKPLISDAKAGAEFLAHKLHAPITKTYRMSIEKKTMSGTRVTAAYPVGPFKSSVIGAASQIYRRSLKVTVSEPPTLLASLGLLDPEVVAWELVPFSFVVDWFMPIGSWLSARAFLSHVTITSYTQTSTARAQAYEPQGSCLSWVNSGGDAFYKRIELSRIVGTGAPKLPLPRVKPLSEALSVLHCLNGIALLEQLGSGFVSKKDRKRAFTNELPPSSHRNGIIPSAQ
jgi:hypothetical protein